MFKKDDPVKLNPTIGEDDFQFGRAEVSYDEIGYVLSVGQGSISVNWPESYGRHWSGLAHELIPATMENV